MRNHVEGLPGPPSNPSPLPIPRSSTISTTDGESLSRRNLSLGLASLGSPTTKTDARNTQDNTPGRQQQHLLLTRRSQSSQNSRSQTRTDRTDDFWSSSVPSGLLSTEGEQQVVRAVPLSGPGGAFVRGRRARGDRRDIRGDRNLRDSRGRGEGRGRRGIWGTACQRRGPQHTRFRDSLSRLALSMAGSFGGRLHDTLLRLSVNLAVGLDARLREREEEEDRLSEILPFEPLEDLRESVDINQQEERQRDGDREGHIDTGIDRDRDMDITIDRHREGDQERDTERDRTEARVPLAPSSPLRPPSRHSHIPYLKWSPVAPLPCLLFQGQLVLPELENKETETQKQTDRAPQPPKRPRQKPLERQRQTHGVPLQQRTETHPFITEAPPRLPDLQTLLRTQKRQRERETRDRGRLSSLPPPPARRIEGELPDIFNFWNDRYHLSFFEFASLHLPTLMEELRIERRRIRERGPTPPVPVFQNLSDPFQIFLSLNRFYEEDLPFHLPFFCFLNIMRERNFQGHVLEALRRGQRPRYHVRRLNADPHTGRAEEPPHTPQELQDRPDTPFEDQREMEIYPRPPPPPSHLLTLQVPPEWTEMHQMEYLLSVWRQRQAQREARGGTGVGGGRPHVGFFEALAEGVTPPPRGTPPPPFETFVPPAPPPIQTPLPVPRPAIQPGQRPQGPALVRIARILRLRPKPNRNVTQQQQPEDPPPADPQLARVHRALRAAKAKIRPRQTRPAPPSTPRPKARLPQHRPSGPPNRLGIRYLNLGTPPGPPPPLVGPLLLSIATQRNLTRGLQQGRRLPFRPPPGVPPPPIASLERAAAALRPLPKPVPKGKANPTHPVAKAKIQMMQRPETTHPVAVGPPPPPPAPKRAAKAKPLPPVAKAKIRQRIPPPEAKEAGLPPRGVLQIASPFNDQREPHVARRVYQLSRKEMTHQEIQRRGIIAMSSRFKRLRTGLPLAPAPPMKLNRGPHLTPSRHPRHPIPDQLTTRLGDWARSHAVLPNGLRVLLVISPSGAFALWVGKERSLGSNYPPWLMGLFDERLPLVKKLKTAKRLVYRTKMVSQSVGQSVK
uniref:Uncharacterized protein n=1 Tax=Chromera velia CCMP2878 TaxID=1169474 RepID=A0A0G4HXG4_9ALVE|eukprot:Cvel_33121.t1-p1 / transcript=Cvel_33121.t1 / gene=Cvel_33121 / organism=Chromera_velia_CCMP2878 / gene_product=hypothetical protein / transcript_product=hypothetical protein / location=Cvel_scaffold5299:136-3342(-) / protein_length=1069 / sequence_SO=supercontig / SO=protein_coding / is_pseudo=false